MMAKRLPHGLLLFTLLLCGCNRQDTDALMRISQKVQARTEVVTGAVQSTAASSWHVVGDLGVEMRVAARLRWDKELADLALEVLPCGSGVELRGKVRNLEQRRRAVMIADTTAGVDGVKDSLTESN
jgi:osmotically-inducible protein OsmY